MPNDDFAPRILSEEEVEMYLKGDRREVDRLILYSLNRLAACLIPHAEKEDKRDVEYDRVLHGLGGLDMMLKRASYVDALIAQAEAKTRMMEKVTQSSILWVLLPFFGFAASSMWDAAVRAIKAALLKEGG